MFLPLDGDVIAPHPEQAHYERRKLCNLSKQSAFCVIGFVKIVRNIKVSRHRITNTNNSNYHLRETKNTRKENSIVKTRIWQKNFT
jgi:hypothetical protein